MQDPFSGLARPGLYDTFNDQKHQQMFLGIFECWWLLYDIYSKEITTNLIAIANTNKIYKFCMVPYFYIHFISFSKGGGQSTPLDPVLPRSYFLGKFLEYSSIHWLLLEAFQAITFLGKKLTLSKDIRVTIVQVTNLFSALGVCWVQKLSLV